MFESFMSGISVIGSMFVFYTIQSRNNNTISSVNNNTTSQNTDSSKTVNTNQIMLYDKKNQISEIMNTIKNSSLKSITDAHTDAHTDTKKTEPKTETGKNTETDANTETDSDNNQSITNLNSDLNSEIDNEVSDTVSDIYNNIKNNNDCNNNKKIDNIESENLNSINVLLKNNEDSHINKTYIEYTKKKMIKNELDEIKPDYYKIKSKTLNNLFKCILEKQNDSNAEVIMAQLFMDSTNMYLIFEGNILWTICSRTFRSIKKFWPRLFLALIFTIYLKILKL